MAEQRSEPWWVGREDGIFIIQTARAHPGWVGPYDSERGALEAAIDACDGWIETMRASRRHHAARLRPMRRGTKRESENAAKTPPESGGNPPTQLNVKAIVIG